MSSLYHCYQVVIILLIKTIMINNTTYTISNYLTATNTYMSLSLYVYIYIYTYNMYTTTTSNNANNYKCNKANAYTITNYAL